MIFDDAIASTRRGVLEQVDIENSIGTSITDQFWKKYSTSIGTNIETNSIGTYINTSIGTNIETSIEASILDTREVTL